MAGKGATLQIRIVSDASKASAGFEAAESRVSRFESRLDRATPIAAGVVAGIGLVAQQAYEAASALEQSSGAVESVFGAQANAVKQLAADAATAVGLSANSYQELASVLGSQLQGMGYAGKAAVDQTQELIGVGADLAATFGGSTSDAVEALSSLLRGERDPIERYGIAISQAAVDAKIAALGLDTSTDAAKRASQAQATLALVQEQSANASGAFAREGDTAAGATQRAAAQFENAKAQLGDVLLPVVSTAMSMFSDFTGFLTEHATATQIVLGVVAGLAAAVLLVNGAMTAYRAITAIATAAQWLWNVAMTANPIGLIIVAIVAIIAAVVLAYNKFKWFRDFIASVGKFLGSVFDGFMSVLGWIADKLSWIGDAASWVGDLFSSPITVNATGGGTAGAGMFGAAAGAGGGAFRGASLMGSLPGGAGPSTGQGPGQAPIVVNIDGALDPVAVGRQIEKILRDYARTTGRTVTSVTR